MSELVERIEDVRDQLHGWMAAYPLSAFPEPDLTRAAHVLRTHGMTLDSISASNMRHVVQKIAPETDAILAAAIAHIEELEGRLNASDSAARTNTDFKTDFKTASGAGENSL